MPNLLQLTFLLSTLLTFGTLFIFTGLLGSYFNIPLPFFDLPGNQSAIKFISNVNVNHDMNFLENIRALTQTSSGLATAGVVLLGTCALLYFNLKLLAPRTPVLDPKKWQEFPLDAKIIVSPNTALYRFGLPKKSDILGLPIGQHISVAAMIEGKDIVRSYTPTSSDDDLGHFDLLVKTYEKGNISRYLSLLKIGDKIRVRGPKAGGTGITPMLQIIRAALKNPLDNTELSLIYANVNDSDILLKKELDELAETNSSRFRVYYVLNNPPAGWKGGVGFVSKEQIQQHLFPASEDCKTLLCGPPPMMNAMKKHLDELKFPAPRVISKLNDQVFLF